MPFGFNGIASRLTCRSAWIVSIVYLLLCVTGLYAAAPCQKIFVCNPFSEARKGPVLLPPENQVVVDAAIQPLDIQAFDLRSARQIVRAEKTLEGLFVVGAPSDGLCRILLSGDDCGWVVDRNGNGKPDFAGDRWAFDCRGDQTVETVIEMTDSDRDGKAERFRFFLAGENWFGLREQQHPRAVAQRALPIQAALDGDKDLGTPTAVWLDKNGDGTWCRGSVLTGGQISCDWLVLDREHQIWHGLMKEVRHYDLDGDGDIDIRAFSGADPIQRGANIDGSDQAANPEQTYDWLAGTGFYRWPPVEREVWRQQYGTFDMRKNTNKLLADLRRKYDLWMNMQDTPHGVIDLDNDGVRDVFVGVSVSGGPSDVFERPGRSPAVWQTLERFFIGFGERGQLNFNLDVNPLKRERPDRNVSLQLKTYRDPWGNELKNFVGAFSPPNGWDGKAVSAFDADGKPADWMWLWDWHLSRPFGDLYVANWVKDWRHTGEGAAVNLVMQDHWAEADFDCSTDFTVYYSPLIGRFHLKGIEWGWWNIRNLPVPEIKQRFGDLKTEYSLFDVNQFRYGNEVADTDLRRFHAASWACYFDRDTDGIVDTYLFDVDNNGDFETRVWYDRSRGRLLWAEGNTFRETDLKLEFPSQSLKLGNYRVLRSFYRKQMEKGQGLVDTSGKVHVDAGRSVEAQAVVAFDAYHAGGFVAWADLGRSGFSRLFTSIARRPVAITTVRRPFDRASLQGITHLVVTELAPERGPKNSELQAIDDWLQSGGRLLIVLPSTDCSSLAQWTSRYGIHCDRLLQLTSGRTLMELSTFTSATGARLDYGLNKDGFLIDAAFSLSLRGEAHPLLTWHGTDDETHILAAETPLGDGRVFVAGAVALLNNKYTSYRPKLFSPFDPRRLSNRRWLEDVVERWLDR